MHSSDDGATLSTPVSARDHAEGDANAPVTLVEYGDYECPHCGRAYPILKEVQRRMGAQLRFVFRNFPLREMHPHAQHAAEAAEGAGAQDRFWEMHDLLFENQQALADRHLRDYAARLALDTERFDRDLSSHAHARRVREDFLSGVRSGVNGTPTFFINGVRHDDAWDPDSLMLALRRAIVARNAAPMRP
jgi:protein-disulfide isomerase